MERQKEITLLTNPAIHTMEHNGYIKNALIIEDGENSKIIHIYYNKEYFN